MGQKKKTEEYRNDLVWSKRWWLEKRKGCVWEDVPDTTGSPASTRLSKDPLSERSAMAEWEGKVGRVSGFYICPGVI